MMSSDFNKLSIAFLEEFKQRKDSTFHENLQIADLRTSGRGRGIIASEDISADTDLFTIPRDYVISVENSRLYKLLPQIFEQSDASLTNGAEVEQDNYLEDGSPLPKPWLDLILVLIHDYLHRATSKWNAYWDVLPDSFDTLMFWSEEELSELRGSAIPGRIGKASADEMFQKHTIPLIKLHEKVFYSSTRLTDAELLRLCHRMGSLIMSYAFDLQTSNEDEVDEQDGWAEDNDTPGAMGMVPMADMLNADAEFNAHLEHGETNLTMRSLRPIKKGEEILNYYGPLGNGDLARRYGYTSTLHSRYDVVEIPWEMVLTALRDQFGASIDFTQAEPDPEDLEEVFVLERETGDPDESGRFSQDAKFTAFPEELVDQVSAFVSVGLGIPRGKKPSEDEKRRLKGNVLRILYKAVALRISEYAGSDSGDAQALVQPEVTRRLKMAIDIRSGERKLLMEALAYTETLLPKYADVEGGGTGSEQPPQKKQKRQR